MSFEIKYQDAGLQHIISVLSQELLHPQELLGSIGESLLRVNRQRHLNSLEPDGTPMEPLKPSSLLDKRRGGPLNKSGQTIDSFNYQVEGNSLLLGFDGARNAQLAFWHFKGTDPYTIKPKNGKALKFGDRIVKKVNHPGLPSRKLIGYPESDRHVTEDAAYDYLRVKLNIV